MDLMIGSALGAAMAAICSVALGITIKGMMLLSSLLF